MVPWYLEPTSTQWRGEEIDISNVNEHESVGIRTNLCVCVSLLSDSANPVLNLNMVLDEESSDVDKVR